VKDAQEYGRISHAHRQYSVERYGGIGIYDDVPGIKAAQKQWQYRNQLFFCELSRTRLEHERLHMNNNQGPSDIPDGGICTSTGSHRPAGQGGHRHRQPEGH
jgi:hypothetical protein